MSETHDIPLATMYIAVVTCPHCGVVNKLCVVDPDPGRDGDQMTNGQRVQLSACGHLMNGSKIILHRVTNADLERLTREQD